jgi:hypothetical protein
MARWNTNGLNRVTENCSSRPVTGPSPLVVWFGLGWMPFNTLLAAVKEFAITGCENFSCPGSLELRDWKATSEGEFTRVGTCEVENVGAPEVRLTSESAGKIW